ncbi:MAG: chitobiase/beta-hexosaminidase C-terminal domain-containing protein [Syntrophomonas sp.]
MRGKFFFNRRYYITGFILLFFVLFTFGCDSDNTAQSKKDNNQADEKAIVVTGNGVKQDFRITLPEMLELPDARFEHVYSIINNWPVKKMYAARGIKLSALLKAAGIKDKTQAITIKGYDGYVCSFTREQLLETGRYYFPGLKEGDPSGAEPVEPIIAYQYAENSNELSKARDNRLCFIMPQANINEQTNHAFVKGVTEIIATTANPGKWAEATVFPPAGEIAAGDTVKLQHKDIGMVKMYYTLDGSKPTRESTLYNPSTYQPELNKPIAVDRDMTIKVLVKGFGRYDSDIAEFHYRIKQ